MAVPLWAAESAICQGGRARGCPTRTLFPVPLSPAPSRTPWFGCRYGVRICPVASMSAVWPLESTARFAGRRLSCCASQTVPGGTGLKLRCLSSELPSSAHCLVHIRGHGIRARSRHDDSWCFLSALHLPRLSAPVGSWAQGGLRCRLCL